MAVSVAFAASVRVVWLRVSVGPFAFTGAMVTVRVTVPVKLFRL